MANIKISELNELEQVDNDDLLVIVDTSANETKKVKARNVGTGGGGSDVVIISDTQPTSEDNKLWIDTGEVGESFTEITNEYSTSTGKGYSANYINELLSKIFGENSRISDMNTTLETGVYQYIGTTTNLPSNLNPYGTLIVFKSTQGGEIYIQQIAIGNSIYGTYTKKVAIRTIVGNNFGEWYYL